MIDEELDDIDPKDIENLLGFIDGIDENDVNYDFIMESLNLDLKSLELEMQNHIPKITLNFLKSHDNTTDPNYVYESDSGFDLHSVEDIVIPPFGRALVPSGLSFDIRDMQSRHIQALVIVSQPTV